MLVQESQQFKHNFLLLFMKLRWFLKRWRQGKVLPSEGDDFLEVWFPWNWDWGGNGVEERGGEGAPSWVNTTLGLRSEPSSCSFHPSIRSLICISLLRASSSLSAVAGAGDKVVKTWSQTRQEEVSLGARRSLPPLWYSLVSLFNKPESSAGNRIWVNLMI